MEGWEREDLQEGHQIRHERVTRPVDNLEESGQKGHSDDSADEPSFKGINDKELERGLVESVTFFNDKGAVHR